MPGRRSRLHHVSMTERWIALANEEGQPVIPDIRLPLLCPDKPNKLDPRLLGADTIQWNHPSPKRTLVGS